MSINADYVVKIRRACSEIIGRIGPFLQFFTEVRKWAKVSPELLHQTKVCTRCSHIQCASKLPIGVPIFQYISERQRDKENFSAKNADFRTFVGCHSNVPWESVKWMQNLSSPYITLPIHNIFEQIPIIWCKDRENRPMDPEIICLH